MIPWLDGAIPYLKALHIAALLLWCAGLFALPLMLARHDPAIGQADYSRIRLASHYGYTLVVTPAALIAIAAGTLLIFVREVFAVWMFAKLVFVALLIGFHAWVGHTIVTVAETEGEHQTPGPLVPLLLLLVPVLAILVLVLAKPKLEEVPLPDWLMTPRGGQLPFDVPR
ncbi:CopD family protein [Microvirga lotononidis]|uniref:Protoporphyrinogen IX oxidase n=1 Tax=Microvirga lotononidis TaxID=864069 RepID=I4YS34_9HYPH|nr:CopD family protein [Microvirga lotononidis]EIM26776.1 putative membrane protein [Microvirga lotononidis]WQO31682.1 CopD family protein [Microvirga lotononidis]